MSKQCDTVFRDAVIIDGSANEPYDADVAITGDRISAVDELDACAAKHMLDGQVPLANGAVVAGRMVVQARQAIENLVAILKEVGYGPEHVVRCGVWLDDHRDVPRSIKYSRNILDKIRPPALVCFLAWSSIARQRSTMLASHARSNEGAPFLALWEFEAP